MPDIWTGTWRDARPINPEGPQPENALTGTIFTGLCGWVGGWMGARVCVGGWVRVCVCGWMGTRVWVGEWVRVCVCGWVGARVCLSASVIKTGRSGPEVKARGVDLHPL